MFGKVAAVMEETIEADGQSYIIKTENIDDLFEAENVDGSVEDYQDVMNEKLCDTKEHEEPIEFVDDSIKEENFERDLGKISDFWSESICVKKEKPFDSPIHQQGEEEDDDVIPGFDDSFGAENINESVEDCEDQDVMNEILFDTKEHHEEGEDDDDDIPDDIG